MLVLSDAVVAGDPAPNSVAEGALSVNFHSRRMHLGVPPSISSNGLLLVGDILQIDTALAARPTATQMNTALSGYSPLGHHHEISDVNGLTAALAAATSTLPTGFIGMWSGTIASIPVGWAICNGQNGTPNLTDKFIIAAGNTYAPGAVGGSTGGAFTTTAAGAHSHGGATAGHQLSWGQMPAHNHGVNDPGHGHGVNDPGHSHYYETVGDGGLLAPGGAVARYGVKGARTEHVGTGIWISGNGTGIWLSNAGGNEAHAHGIGTDGNHAHNVTVSTIPPYYALAYIMKLPPFTP